MGAGDTTDKFFYESDTNDRKKVWRLFGELERRTSNNAPIIRDLLKNIKEDLEITHSLLFNSDVNNEELNTLHKNIQEFLERYQKLSTQLLYNERLELSKLEDKYIK